MVRRSFRVGLRGGLVAGSASALLKAVQARRSTPSAPPERLSRQGTAAFIRRSCTSYGRKRSPTARKLNEKVAVIITGQRHRPGHRPAVRRLGVRVFITGRRAAFDEHAS